MFRKIYCSRVRIQNNYKLVQSKINFSTFQSNKMSNQETAEHVMAKLITTVNFAAIKHINQRRKNKEASPYINHPIGVAYILINEGNVRDLEVLQGALLHDTVEDTATSFEELESNFGVNVRKIVEQVTDDKSLSKDKRKLAQIDHASHLTPQAKLVKMADKLYNLRDLASNPPPSWNLARVQGYFVWAKKSHRWSSWNKSRT